jgi:prepilin-type N-terminal cleavage/methylation domain-containing protein
MGTKSRATRPGFTLFEILIVVVTIGILAAIVVPRFSKAQDDARDEVTKAFAKTLENGVVMYVSQYGHVPRSFHTWVALSASGSRRNYVRLDHSLRKQLTNPNADLASNLGRTITLSFPGGLVARYDLESRGAIRTTLTR